MTNIGPLLLLEQRGLLDQSEIREAARSPALPREHRRFLGLQYLRRYEERVSEDAIDEFLQPSQFPWLPPARISPWSEEEARSLAHSLLTLFGAGEAIIIARLLYGSERLEDLVREEGG